jgi:hypothetical protein
MATAFPSLLNVTSAQSANNNAKQNVLEVEFLVDELLRLRRRSDSVDEFDLIKHCRTKVCKKGTEKETEKT